MIDAPADKPALRLALWQALKDAGAGRFPGIRGRIPNFTGAEAAARHLAADPLFGAAQVLKCNPDLPQRPARHAALKAGKVVYLAVPKLTSDLPFLELDPARLGPGALWSASSIKGATALGRPVGIDDLPPIDLILTGCVGVGTDGARLGKGGGYSDLEFGLLVEAGKVGPDTPIMTTLHPSQRVGAGVIPVEDHDISVDRVALPDGVIAAVGRPPRPTGIDWTRLSDARLAAMPALARLKPR